MDEEEELEDGFQIDDADMDDELGVINEDFGLDEEDPDKDK